MKRPLTLIALAAMSALSLSGQAAAQSEYDGLISSQAQANGVPEALVHRVIQRESRYRPGAIGRCGCVGLMQIKLATARSLGYTGDAAGLRDPNTNLTYGVKYLAGAYRAAGGDQNRAMHYYASGYYGAAKRQGVQQVQGIQQVNANGPFQAYAMAPQVYAMAPGPYHRTAHRRRLR
jgi:soluble lytic murein transglycosylase-like protein